MALGGEVELRLAVVRGRRHRLDVAVLGVDRDDRRRGSDAGEAAADRGARGLLLLEVDRRVDAQPALAHGLGAVLLDQLVLDVVEEERLAAAGEVARRVDAEPALHRLLRGLRRDHLEVGHLGQHLVAAGLGLLGRAHRRVGGRRLREAGQQRGLVQLEVLDRLPEVHARRRLHADRGLAAERAERHRVQVLVEDPRLARARSRAPRRAWPRGSCAGRSAPSLM